MYHISSTTRHGKSTLSRSSASSLDFVVMSVLFASLLKLVSVIAAAAGTACFCFAPPDHLFGYVPALLEVKPHVSTTLSGTSMQTDAERCV